MRHTLNAIDPLPLKLGRKHFKNEDSWTKEELASFAILSFQHDEHDPHITEADCRKRKSAPAEQPKQSTDAPQFKVGDRVRVIADCSFSGVEARVVGIDTLISIEWGVRGARSDARVRASSLELLPTEPAPQEPQADAEGWVSWNPSTQGRPPLPADARVALRVDDGSVVWAHGLRVDSANWAPDSIIRAFRIVA
jgi:hypothetical protein